MDDSDSLYEDPPKENHQNASAGPDLIVANTPGTQHFQLILDKPRKLYAAGNTITGLIEGWNVESGAHIHIILEGCAKVVVAIGNNVFKDRAVLLYEITHVKPESQGTVSRFSMTIPENVTPLPPAAEPIKAHWAHDWPAHASYESAPGHPLPPSTELPVKTLHTLRESATCRASISYKLTAILSYLSPSTNHLVPESSHQVPIFLTTLRLPSSTLTPLLSHPSKMTTNLTIQTRQLSTPSRLSLYQRLKDPFSASAPSFLFYARTSLPSVSSPGVGISVGIEINVLPPPLGKLYNFPVPNILVSSYVMRVRSYQGLRMHAPSAGNPARMKTYVFKAVEVRRTEQPEFMFRPESGGFEGQVCTLGCVGLSEDMVPSYKTFSLWRTYRLKVEVVLRVAGKEAVIRVKEDLNIIAREVQSEEESASKASGKRDMEREERDSGREQQEVSFQTANEAASVLTVGVAGAKSQDEEAGGRGRRMNKVCKSAGTVRNEPFINALAYTRRSSYPYSKTLSNPHTTLESQGTKIIDDQCLAFLSLNDITKENFSAL
ncbi:hypothetical protein CC78DRAFT_568886 [Lojkania enalia]|uniref:Uncharacterized protein n=1 Tax=Lojkania enalia TaxID=147567 RepID=A0A9P4N2S7_9PLEO|nr:hypothetical protein CC78DRAFT_568886 [Didymosphaeria enalia]